MVTINKFKNKLFRSIGLLFVTLSLLLLIFPSTALATTYEQYGTTSMISNCDTLTGWSKSTLGTMAIDNALYLQGNGSVKLTSTNTSAIYGEFDNSNFNCSGKFVALSIYIDNVTALGDFRFYIFNNTAYTSFAYYSYPTNRLSNGWNNITLPLGRSAWTYSNFTDADFGVFAILRVRFYAIDNTSTVAINVDNILSVANTFSTGKVTFSFDDCINTTYATAKPLMDAFGYAGIAFVPTSYVGGSGRMTLANLLEMQSAGWDISSHSVNHVDLTALTTATLISELADSRSWLANNGFPNGSRFLANPFYHTNTTVQSYVSQYFNMSRPWDSTFESLPPCDWNGVRCYATTNTTTASTLTSLIANATYFGDWLIINMHTTTTGDLSQSTYMTNTTLQTVLQYCHDNSVNVVTFSQVYNAAEYVPYDPVATPTPAPTTYATGRAYSVFGSIYTAISMFAIVGIICVASAIFIVIKSSEADPSDVAKVVAVLILIAIGCAIATVLTFAMQNVNGLAVLASVFHHG